MMKINDYINYFKTTFDLFAFSVVIKKPIDNTFEHIPYLLKNAEDARRKITDLLGKPNTQGAIKAQMFLNDIVNNRHFVMLDSTLNLSELYSEWDDLLPVKADPKPQQSQSTGGKDIPLPVQLQPIAIKTPIQRSKLYEQLKKDAYIAEDTVEDCFNWVIGSTVEPRDWKPIQWILINEKGSQRGESNSSALREFLILLIYDNVYTEKCNPKHLKKTEKLIAQELFMGLENKPIILRNAKSSDSKDGKKGYTSKYTELRDYIHIAKNAK